MAGHSKWANIQHRKNRQDSVRAKVFSKMSKEITVAAKMGDPDPDKNPRLRLAVKEAKAVSVPKDVIDRAIKKSTAQDGEDYEEVRYEGYGPNGVAVIVEAMTEAAKSTGLVIPSEQAVRDIIGLGLPEAIATLFPDMDEPWLAEKLRQHYSDHYVALEARPAELFPGVAEGLERFRSAGRASRAT